MYCRNEYLLRDEMPYRFPKFNSVIDNVLWPMQIVIRMLSYDDIKTIYLS